MKIIQLVQGSPEWVQFRSTRFGSSEAAAMLGLSEHTTRNELLRLKATGIAHEFSGWVQRNVLDHGHAVEAATRPVIELEIGDDLYQVVCTEDDEASRIVVSCDGLTLDSVTAWECKQWNEQLAAIVRSGEVPDNHMPQCQQILMVTGAQRLIFTVSDGDTKWVSTEVAPSAEWFSTLRRGWDQFAEDLAAYTPPAAIEVVTAATQEHLPAVSVQVNGALAVVSNLPAFGTALKAFIAKIPKKPTTDQEFADTDAACKRLKEAEERLQAAEDQALASMSDVNEMRRMVGEFREAARTARLAAEKIVKARKEQIREEEVARGVAALRDHIQALNDRMGQSLMPAIPADFGGAIKGLKTFDSLRNAIDTELARVKIAANEIADRIAVNLRAIEKAQDPQLFPDLAALVQKAPDDLLAVVGQRVAARNQRREAEQAAQREAEARRIAEAEQRGREQEAARIAEEQRRAEAVAAQAIAQAAAPAPAAVIAKPVITVDLEPAAPDPMPEREEPATLKLGTICERLGFTMTGVFVSETLGVQRVASDKAAKLYRESQFPLICMRLRAHIQAVDFHSQKATA